MAILKQHFFTNGETFYFLDFPRHAMRPLHVDGIGPSYYRAFPDRYNKGRSDPVLHAVAGTRGRRESPCLR
jgi:hypothetical protein